MTLAASDYLKQGGGLVVEVLLERFHMILSELHNLFLGVPLKRSGFGYPVQGLGRPCHFYSQDNLQQKRGNNFGGLPPVSTSGHQPQGVYRCTDECPSGESHTDGMGTGCSQNIPRDLC